MPEPLVYLDMDDVLTQCNKRLAELCLERFGVRVSVGDMASYWIEDQVVKSNPNVSKRDVQELVFEKGFFESLEIMPGAQDGVARLVAAGAEVMILTSLPPRTAPKDYFVEGKLLWLERYFPELVRSQNIIMSYRKDIFRDGILIDDAPHHLLKFLGKAIIFDAPWNRRILNLPRANGWAEVPGVYETVSQKGRYASQNTVRPVP